MGKYQLVVAHCPRAKLFVSRNSYVLNTFYGRCCCVSMRPFNAFRIIIYIENSLSYRIYSIIIIFTYLVVYCTMCVWECVCTSAYFLFSYAVMSLVNLISIRCFFFCCWCCRCGCCCCIKKIFLREFGIKSIPFINKRTMAF